MSVGQARDEFTRQLSEQLSKTDNAVGRSEITAIVESVLNTLQGNVSVVDIRVYDELEALAQFIHETRAEIAAIHPSDIADEHIATATDELDAIVAATEEATGTILDAAEKIEALAPGMGPDNSGAVSEAVTMIYEACNFQDVTGQRIGKVVKALKDIERKVDALVSAFGHDSGKAEIIGSGSVAKNAKGGTMANEADLLEGPQLPGDGISQDDVDSLLSADG